jgi:hypothetical protein
MVEADPVDRETAAAPAKTNVSAKARIRFFIKVTSK